MRLSAKKEALNRSQGQTPRTRRRNMVASQKNKVGSAGTVGELLIARLESQGVRSVNHDQLVDFLVSQRLVDAEHAHAEAAFMFSKADRNCDGELDVGELTDLLEELTSGESEPGPEEMARHLFKLAHKDPQSPEDSWMTAVITEEELRVVLKLLTGEEVTKGTVALMFKESDKDRDGTLDIHETTALLAGFQQGTGLNDEARVALSKSFSHLNEMQASLKKVRILDGIDGIPGMSQRQKALLREVFDQFDKGEAGAAKDGQLSRSEVTGFLLTVGAIEADTDSKEAQEYTEDLLNMLDVDNDGTVSFEEFVKYAEANDQLSLGGRDDDELFDELFAMLDKSGDGFISVHELETELSGLGFRMSTEDVYAVVKEMDVDDDDVTLNPQEFKALLKRLSRH